jgi:hypothetical protein
LAREAETAIIKVVTSSRDPEMCSEPLLAALTGANLSTRCALLRLLGQADGPKALDAVRSDLKHANPDVQDAAMNALAEWPNASAVNDLLILAREANREARHVQALRGYLRLAGQRPAGDRIGLYEGAMRAARRTEEKKLILSAVEKLPPGLAAIRLVQTWLQDKSILSETLACEVELARALPPAQRAEAIAALKQAKSMARDQQLLGRIDAALALLAPPPERPTPPPRATPETQPKKPNSVADQRMERLRRQFLRTLATGGITVYEPKLPSEPTMVEVTPECFRWLGRTQNEVLAIPFSDVLSLAEAFQFLTITRRNGPPVKLQGDAVSLAEMKSLLTQIQEALKQKQVE